MLWTVYFTKCGLECGSGRRAQIIPIHAQPYSLSAALRCCCFSLAFTTGITRHQGERRMKKRCGSLKESVYGLVAPLITVYGPNTLVLVKS